MNAKQKVAIVTGGGRGLGRAMVLGLLQHDVAVAAVDRDKEPLEALSAATENRKAPLLTIAEDLTSPHADERTGKAVMSAFGRIDILVNNAGMGQSVLWPDHWVRPLRFWNIEPDQWRRFFDINAHATFLMSRMAAKKAGAPAGWSIEGSRPIEPARTA